MKLNREYRVPEGFEPILNYREDPNGTPIENCARLFIRPKKGYGSRNDYLDFDLQDGIPKLPLKKYGELWHTGWDISTRYAIDGENGCWLDNAHGGLLQKVDAHRLIFSAESEQDQNELRCALGQEIPMPSWAKIALAEGWKPPEGWTWKKS